MVLKNLSGTRAENPDSGSKATREESGSRRQGGGREGRSRRCISKEKPAVLSDKLDVK